MESKTKNKQNIEMIEQMIMKVFGKEQLRQDEKWANEMKEGYFNVAYTITLQDGKEVILKIAPPVNAEIMSYEKNIMKTEVEAMQMIREKTNVPVPEVYFYDDSRTLCSAEYFFMEKIQGINYQSIRDEISQERKNRIDTQIGKYNRDLNEIKGDYYGYPGQRKLQGNCWADIFVKLVEDVLNDGEKKNVDLGVSYGFMRNLIQSLKDVLKSVATPYFVHWDLWAGNVLIKDDVITGIIDFERALWGDALIENHFRTIIEGDAPKAFLQGYGITEFSENERKKRALYNIHLYLIMIIECKYREYENDDQYIWAKEKLQETLKYLGY